MPQWAAQKPDTHIHLPLKVSLTSQNLYAIATYSGGEAVGRLEKGELHWRGQGLRGPEIGKDLGSLKTWVFLR